MVRVPNKPKPVREEDALAIRDAERKVAEARQTYRDAVLAALRNGASYRETHRITGLATSTLRMWKNAPR